MSLIATLPLLIALFTAVGAIYYILQRKSLAQAICVQQGAQIQNELRQTLKKLLRLNKPASSLRVQRQNADLALDAALSSGYAPAIAAAQAVQTAVILQQMSLRAQQTALLMEAERQRQTGQRELRRRVNELASTPVEAPVYFYRALAVEAKPLTSLSPNYEPVPLFTKAQQQRFRFAVNLKKGFPLADQLPLARQTTECSVSLEGKDDTWDIHIVAAKAH